MYNTGMLYPGSRVGIAVSGGADSWVLLQIMLLQARRLPFDIDIMALHVNPGFDMNNHAPLLEWLGRNGVAGYAELQDMGLRAHTAENRKKSPCFFCSWRRRKRLFQLVKEYKLTHIALGHNSDDLVQTFFMNICYAGRVEGLFPKESFFKGEFELIRPLLLVEEKDLKKAAHEWQLPVWPNPCPSSQNSSRQRMQETLEKLSGRSKKIEKSIYSAIKRWQMNNLLD